MALLILTTVAYLQYVPILVFTGLFAFPFSIIGPLGPASFLLFVLYAARWFLLFSRRTVSMLR